MSVVFQHYIEKNILIKPFFTVIHRHLLTLKSRMLKRDVFLLLDGPEGDFKLYGGIQPITTYKYPISPDSARIHRCVDLDSGRNLTLATSSSIRFSFGVLMLQGLASWTKHLYCHSRWTASVQPHPCCPAILRRISL